MSKAGRQVAADNHYVPKWYQKGFIEPGRDKLRRLDMLPPKTRLRDGRVVTGNAVSWRTPSECFFQRHLYSTFFGTGANDEIERRLFGKIDTKGSQAVRAFAASDQSEWHRHFQDFFQYIDVQKLRTPKGLAWLSARYPYLTHNQLLFEMQAVLGLNATFWTEGVREIVSAEESEIKFIVSDNPVTIYNYAAAPEQNPFPKDPDVSQKATQTIFPLNKDFCLVLTNLEYAKDHSVAPLEKRTFARNFRNSLVRTDAFIRSRKFDAQSVSQINYILKSRATRFVAAGEEEWLFPEKQVNGSWENLQHTLLPPEDETWRFGGELYAKYDDGTVHYQDQYGRTEKQRDFLRKEIDEGKVRPRDFCGCGSGRKYGTCCKPLPRRLRPTWSELSIRERNIAHFNATMDILGFKEGMDWNDIRGELTDEKIRQSHIFFEGLWPLDTDILELLPKPDGQPRAVYTGFLHPNAIGDFAIGSAIYFGEILIENPMIHPGAVQKEFSPVENPKQYRTDFLKNIMFMFSVMPLVEEGIVNLIPDPCWFDVHLREQMMRMAKERTAALNFDLDQDERIKQIMFDDQKRTMLSLPAADLKAMFNRDSEKEAEIDDAEFSKAIGHMRLEDPLVVLQEDTFSGGEKSGQIQMMKMGPNFEIAMYLAQATGSVLVTDSPHRWQEFQQAAYVQRNFGSEPLSGLIEKISAADFLFANNTLEIPEIVKQESAKKHMRLMARASKYLSQIAKRGKKINWEKHVAAQFPKMHEALQAAVSDKSHTVVRGKISPLMPSGGIWHTNASRLLLMAGVDNHLPYVPMAFFFEPAT